MHIIVSACIAVIEIVLVSLLIDYVGHAEEYILHDDITIAAIDIHITMTHMAVIIIIHYTIDTISIPMDGYSIYDYTAVLYICALAI